MRDNTILIDLLEDKDRIEAVLKHLKTSRNALGKAIGDSNGMRIEHVIKGRNNISSKLASDITNKFKQISYDWLIDGSGEMIVSLDISEETIESNQTIELIEGLRAHLPEDKQEDLDIIINEYKAALAWKAKYARVQKDLEKYQSTL